jgi:1-acyl-sn-glycerol-3-phosphate acyltransferase
VIAPFYGTFARQRMPPLERARTQDSSQGSYGTHDPSDRAKIDVTLGDSSLGDPRGQNSPDGGKIRPVFRCLDAMATEAQKNIHGL